MVCQSLLEFLELLHRTSEGTARHHSLLVGRHLFELQTGDSVEFTHHPLADHSHALADRGGIGLLKFQSRGDPHSLETQGKVPPHTPETIRGGFGHDPVGIRIMD